MYPNRTVCEALREMRELNKTRNFAPLLGLIEEVQSMVNRMEASLLDQGDLQHARKSLRKVRRELEKKSEELEELNA